jgi:hypothetical protein
MAPSMTPIAPWPKDVYLRGVASGAASGRKAARNELSRSLLDVRLP